MKVLKEGNKKKWGIELKCTGAGNGEHDGACGAKLLVEENDVFTTQEGGYDGSGDICYTIECPQCKTWTDIPRTKLPSWIRDKAMERKKYPSDRGKEPKHYGD